RLDDGERNGQRTGVDEARQILRRGDGEVTGDLPGPGGEHVLDHRRRDLLAVEGDLNGLLQEVFGKLLPTIGVIPGELKVHDRLVAAVESDVGRIQMLAGEWRRERLELPGGRRVGGLELGPGLSRGAGGRVPRALCGGRRWAGRSE